MIVIAIFGGLPLGGDLAILKRLGESSDSRELVATVMAIESGIIPPTAKYTQLDPECDLDYVPNQAREKPVRVAMLNSFAFGGLNAILLVRRFE